MYTPAQTPNRGYDADQLTPGESREFENRVDQYKADTRDAIVKTVSTVNEVRVFVAGAAGDQEWDLWKAGSFWRDQVPPRTRDAMDAGRHVVLTLPDGSQGLKIDGERIDQTDDLVDATERWKRALVKRCVRYAKANRIDRGVGVVTFDIDDTLFSSREPIKSIAPTAQVLADMIRFPKLPDLAIHWHLPPTPDLRVMPFLVTARAYSIEAMELCMDELEAMGIRLPPYQSLWLRPPEAFEM